MGITNLGAVSMSAGGVYNPETVYKKYKVVSANGGSYMYINPTPAAGVPVTDTTHWQQIAEKGDKGDTGAKIVSAAWSGNDMLLTLDDTSAVTLTGAKTTLKGDTGDIINIKVDGATKTKAAGVVDLTSDFARYALWRKTASGNPVSVYPAPESPLYPKVIGTFTQAGTGDPSPENIRPITPWLASGGTAKVKRTGKNLFDLSTSLGFYSIYSGLTNTIDVPNNKIRVVCSVATRSGSIPLPVVAGKTYIVSANGLKSDGKKLELCILKDGIAIPGSTNSVFSYSFTAVANSEYRLYAVFSNAIAYYDIYNIQLELGSTATPYEPYSGQEIALTAPQEIPAGWMDNEGKGQVTWSKQTHTGGFNSAPQPAEQTLARFYKIISPYAMNADIVSDRFMRRTGIPAIEGIGFPNANDLNVFILKSRLTGWDDGWTTAQKVSAFHAWVSENPITVCALLSTPVNITPAIAPLSALPQLDRITPRQNVLTASTGNIELTYAKSPIREADELAAAIALL